jgi:hypothetical protein
MCRADFGFLLGIPGFIAIVMQQTNLILALQIGTSIQNILNATMSSQFTARL